MFRQLTRDTVTLVALASLLWLAGLKVVRNESQAEPRAGKSKKTKEICITFDQLPATGSFIETDGRIILEQILAALKKHEVRAAGFVVAGEIGEDFDLIGKWLNDGHVLGNLTYSNQDLTDVGADPFIRDMIKGDKALEPMLSGFGQKRRYFRYPFLRYGTTVSGRRAVDTYLEDHDIALAHATVLVEDYLHNLSFEQLGPDPDSAKYDKILNEYVNHVLDRVEQAEALSMEVLKRPCRQILQLRANALNAAFLNIILAGLEDMGYSFISLDSALADDLYGAPEAYYGLRGVGYIEMIRDSEPDLIPAQ